MDWQEYRIVFTGHAERGLKELAKKRLAKPTVQQVIEAIRDLKTNPIGKTHQLARELAAFRSLHVGRCRIVVKVDETCVVVYVVAAGFHSSGEREDIYATLKRAIDSGRVDPKNPA